MRQEGQSWKSEDAEAQAAARAPPPARMRPTEAAAEAESQANQYWSQPSPWSQLQGASPMPQAEASATWKAAQPVEQVADFHKPDPWPATCHGRHRACWLSRPGPRRTEKGQTGCTAAEKVGEVARLEPKPGPRRHGSEGSGRQRRMGRPPVALRNGRGITEQPVEALHLGSYTKRTRILRRYASSSAAGARRRGGDCSLRSCGYQSACSLKL